MPDGLEFLVRPFQSPGSLGRKIIAATPRNTAEKAVLTWGAKAAVPPPKARGGVDVACRATHSTQTALAPDETLTTNMTGPYATFPSYEHQDQLIQMLDGKPITQNMQAWGHFRAGVFTTELFATDPIMHRYTVNSILNRQSKSSCAGDWEQMSGVASAVRGAFADLDADIKAGGAGVTHKCQTSLLLNPGGYEGGIWSAEANPYPTG